MLTNLPSHSPALTSHIPTPRRVGRIQSIKDIGAGKECFSTGITGKGHRGDGKQHNITHGAHLNRFAVGVNGKEVGISHA